jgi:hypothetical protein
MDVQLCTGNGCPWRIYHVSGARVFSLESARESGLSWPRPGWADVRTSSSLAINQTSLHTVHCHDGNGHVVTMPKRSTQILAKRKHEARGDWRQRPRMGGMTKANRGCEQPWRVPQFPAIGQLQCGESGCLATRHDPSPQGICRSVGAGVEQMSIIADQRDAN